MTTNSHTPAQLVRRYLRAEEIEELDELLDLFDPDASVRNAAVPFDDEPGAVERFARGFWDRTERRTFVLHDVAVTGKVVFARADATIRFRQGATFGPITAVDAFTITLPFALRFELNASGLIAHVDIFHETTTAARLAAGTAAAS
ncbi:MAG: hypothetical protein QOJ67_3499 [Acidimicrobiaceae bacterium]|jgi:ketosteroid isomerase-like protein